MKIKSRKIWRVLFISVLSMSLIATPVIVTSCNSSSVNPNGSKPQQPDGNQGEQKPSFPIFGNGNKAKLSINKDIKLNVDHALVSNGKGTSSEMINSLKNILSKNKSLFINNYDRFLPSVFDKMNIDISLKEQWSENSLISGAETVHSWINNDSSILKFWNGYDNFSKDSQIILDAKNSLKDILEKNISSILKNAGMELTDTSKTIKISNNVKAKIVTLQDNPYSLRKDFILIPLEVVENNSKPSTFANAQNGIDGDFNPNDPNKRLLAIPIDLISLKLDLVLKISASNFFEDTTEDLTVIFDLSSHKIEEKVLDVKFNKLVFAKNHKGIYKNTKELDDSMFEVVTNKDILKKLGWINDNVDVPMDTDIVLAELLNGNAAKDLGIQKGEKLISLKVSMNIRDPNSLWFNGLYQIEANVIKNDDSIVTYEYGWKNSDEQFIKDFQLKVKNAYLIESKNNADILSFADSWLRGNGLKSPFFMGRENEDINNLVNIINNNLKMPNTLKAFHRRLEWATKMSQNVRFFNGVKLVFKTAEKISDTNMYKEAILTFDVFLRQGFEFKDKFVINSTKPEGKAFEFVNGQYLSSFKIKTETLDSGIAFYNDLTPEEMNEIYGKYPEMF